VPENQFITCCCCFLIQGNIGYFIHLLDLWCSLLIIIKTSLNLKLQSVVYSYVVADNFVTWLPQNKSFSKSWIGLITLNNRAHTPPLNQDQRQLELREFQNQIKIMKGLILKVFVWTSKLVCIEQINSTL